MCDLPYGCLTAPRATCGPGWRKEVEAGKNKTLFREKTETCSWDIKIDLVEFWKQVKRLCKDKHTPILMFCNTKFGADLINSNPSWFRYDLVWSKSNAVGFLNANQKPMSSHEMIYVFSKAGAYYKRINYIGDFPAGGGGRSVANYLPISNLPNTGTTKAGERCPTSVITIANKKNKGGHPTQKPEELYRWLLTRYCPDGETILDPTAGSFTSCFVAKELGLKAIGIEKDRTFFYKAIAKLIS